VVFEEYAGIRVLRVFLEDPGREMHVREVASISGVSSGSAKRYLDMFHGEGLLLRRRQANLLLHRGNLDNPAFRQIKVAWSVYRIMRSGLVDRILSEISPASVVLFGSVARGEDGVNSDIDIFALGKRGDVDLSRFERALGRKINLVVYDARGWQKKAAEDRPFYESVTLEGIVLHGELPVV
jgi:predicted nucleotidyltransferase